jgi:hypothetical protein
MRRILLVSLFALRALTAAGATPTVQESPIPAGILVLDDCDDKYEGKKEYKDNLTLLDPTGRQLFRVSGFNICESIMLHGCRPVVCVQRGHRSHQWRRMGRRS